MKYLIGIVLLLGLWIATRSNASQVTTKGIADNAITSPKINSSAVTNAKIADGTIDLTTKVTGVLPTANGGTGSSTFTNLGTIGIVIDGGGSTITTGVKGYIWIPFSCTITGWTVTSNATGSIVVDVYKSTYAGFPPVSSIAGSELPTISSSNKGQNLSLSTWTTAVSAGDVIGFSVSSVSSLTWVNVQLRFTK